MSVQEKDTTRGHLKDIKYEDFLKFKYGPIFEDEFKYQDDFKYETNQRFENRPQIRR